MKYVIDSIEEFDRVVDLMREAYIINKSVSAEIKDETRTSQQRKAIEVYCSIMAGKLSGSGKDIMTTMKQDACIPWTQPLFKALVWHPIQLAMFNIKSTTQLSTSQVSKVYEVINRHMGENHGVSMNFPNYDGRKYKD